MGRGKWSLEALASGLKMLGSGRVQPENTSEKMGVAGEEQASQVCPPPRPRLSLAGRGTESTVHFSHQGTKKEKVGTEREGSLIQDRCTPEGQQRAHVRGSGHHNTWECL